MSCADDELMVYLPGRSFPSLSLTGVRCDQMCEHCRGSHLRGMTDIGTSSEIVRIADVLASSGGTGMLISGGCDVNGSVPIMKAIEGIRYASSKGLKVNVHTGFIGREDASLLAEAGVNAFSADVHQNVSVIKDILHLDVPKEAYGDMLDNITASGGRPAPHLTAGFGTDDLLSSAKLLKSKGLNDVVLLALVPTRGTITEGSILSEASILDAVGMLSEIGMNVTLGCMRPRSYRDLEIKCIERGVRNIATPSRRTISWAESNGMKVIEKRTCCVIR